MLEELLETLTDIRDLLATNSQIQVNRDIKMLKVTDVAKILGINNNSANKLWERDDFPGIIIGHKTVERNAFYKWLQEKRF